MTDAGITQIANDIIQVQVPLPYALNIVNCYLLRGATGWTLVDTGLNTEAGRARWKSAMSALEITPGDIEMIVLTHMHPDHFGLAGWWQRHSEPPIPLIIPEREQRQMRPFYERRNTPLYHQWLLECGMDEAAAETLESALHNTRDLTQPHPRQQETLEAGAVIRLGARQFRAIHAPGHSDGQMIFYDESDRLMICGDHVLMRITPNIGVWPHSEPDPLGRFLHSLQALMALDVRLALPGHKWLITDWRGRIEELLAHHHARLALTQTALETGARTVLAVAAQLFDMDRLTPHEWRFALAETLAHLEYLRETGLASRRTNGQKAPVEWRPPGSRDAAIAP